MHAMDVDASTGTELFLFGRPGHELFGSYHAPQGDIARDSAVLLCYPWGQEYLASHRAFLQLAIALSSRGYPVLRFDYSGTGDSSGTAESSTLASWRADVRSAADELKTRAGVDFVCLGGLRLGATLASMVAREMLDVSGVFLWQPIVSGPAYLDEIRQRHQDMLWRAFPVLPLPDVGAGPLYQLGFPLSEALLDELRALSLDARTGPPCPVLIVSNAEDAPMLRLRDRLNAGGATVEYETLPNFAIWHEDVDKGLVPRPTIDRIVTWVSSYSP